LSGILAVVRNINGHGPGLKTEPKMIFCRFGRSLMEVTGENTITYYCFHEPGYRQLPILFCLRMEKKEISLT
jgi:hypothetical protein